MVLVSEKAVGTRELARKMGMTHTMVNRILGTLSYLGLVEKTENRKYRPGPALHVFAAQSMMASRLLPLTIPKLLPFRDEGFTIALATYPPSIPLS